MENKDVNGELKSSHCDCVCGWVVERCLSCMAGISFINRSLVLLHLGFSFTLIRLHFLVDLPGGVKKEEGALCKRPCDISR